MKDKSIEREIKIPRTRMSDCCRLMFLESGEYGWFDISAVPELHPVYPMPPMSRSFYNLGGTMIRIGRCINDVVREVCKACIGMENLDRSHLHTLVFRKNGELEIKFEVV